MSTSSTDMLIRRGGKLSASLMLALLAACATTPTTDLPGADGEKHVSKYADQKDAGEAGASDATHVPPVPHDPALESVAAKAAPAYMQAVQLLKDGNLDGAEAQFKQLTEKFPKLSGAYVNLGLIALQKKQYPQAEAVLRKALEVNPSNPYAYNGLGMALREQGKFADARAAYESALTLDPMYARAHFNLGVLGELYMQDLDLAMSHFQSYQQLQKQPDQTVSNWIQDLERRGARLQPATVAQPMTPAANAEVN